MPFAKAGVLASGLGVCPNIALLGEDVRTCKSIDRPVLDGGHVTSDFYCFLDIWRARSKAVHKIMRVLKPEPNLIHPNMMTNCDGLRMPIIFFMMVEQTNDLVSLDVQRLGDPSICQEGNFRLNFLLVAAPLTTSWFFAFTRGWKGARGYFHIFYGPFFGK
ncbi:hypothetical protein AMTR_s00006p00182250 [Amborella trichopoda]|uniref:Uncharacterized protein n=1 Tax=Amborella trichopoda TaxID=13333 RepID=W1PDC3_AMBTC|nr:hypothetical protein AMTR_s00006p00182250 [Amborella trichopoda]